MRDMCIIRIEAAEVNSMAKSRSETASSEFWQIPSKPSSLAVILRSMGKVVPARAALPSGIWLIRRRASTRRSVSRYNISNHAITWWPKLTGCAVCKWVKPGMIVSVCCSAKSSKPLCKRTNRAMILSVSSRSHRRISVATWSLRLRPVCSFLPTAPTISVRRDSTFICTSSSAIDQLNSPASISRSTCCRPSIIVATSSALKISHSLSMVACAIEPWISCRAKRWSKPTEAVKAATKLSVASLKRPPHICWPWLFCGAAFVIGASVLKSVADEFLFESGLLGFEELAFISV